MTLRHLMRNLAARNSRAFQWQRMEEGFAQVLFQLQHADGSNRADQFSNSRHSTQQLQQEKGESLTLEYWVRPYGRCPYVYPMGQRFGKKPFFRFAPKSCLFYFEENTRNEHNASPQTEPKKNLEVVGQISRFQVLGHQKLIFLVCPFWFFFPEKKLKGPKRWPIGGSCSRTSVRIE